MESSQVLRCELVEHGKLRRRACFQAHLHQFFEPNLVVHARVGERLRESRHCILSHLLRILISAANLHAVVRSVAKREERGARGCVESVLQLGRLAQSVQFDRAGEFLAVVELLAETLGQHLIDADVRQKSVKLLEQTAFVLELLELPLQLVEPHHLRNLGNRKRLHLILESALRVLYEDAEPRVVRGGWVLKRDHCGFRTRSRRHLRKREVQLEAFVILVQQAFVLCSPGSRKLLECLDSLDSQLQIKVLSHQCRHLLEVLFRLFVGL